MLISKVPDNDGEKDEGVETIEEETNSHDYQTANELFELMAKKSNFDTSDVDKLTTRDLVFLYKNIDLGTRLMSNVNELQHKKPNQHVESVVYDEPESEESDISDIYSNEDLHDVFLFNKERIDLLNTPASVENTLCQKLGDLEIQTSDLTSEYDKHFLFKDPYIKEQLKSLKVMSNSPGMEGAVLPASLLDYICCKRLEDNYNFYMENIIRYVKNTIEQLKRISNGDYLTERAKEKWREVENCTKDRRVTTKVLATSTSIPLHVERKVGGRKSTWDDIVHSAVDIRSLSKILEKRIVVEVPKLICGSYKLLSKCCADNVIISCKREKNVVEENKPESRVDVVFQLQRSETGQVMSNISSIMILQTAPAVCDVCVPEMTLPLSLPYKNESDENPPKEKVKIVELEPLEDKETLQEMVCYSGYSDHTEDNFVDVDYTGSYNQDTESLKTSSYQESSDSNDALKEILDKKFKRPKKEVSCNMLPDDLRLTIQKLTMQGALTEETGEDMSQSTAIKKRSPTRARIKSPYENQSSIMEEKKRKKLLEIRERRERKKMALVENCKITKHKYGKGTIMPQSASSVTKLSISNKSFYNSIYGQTANVDSRKHTKGRNCKDDKRDVPSISLDALDDENDVGMSSAEKNSKKYINRSYYLDDAVTEMMYMNMKRNENDGKDLCSTSTSVISNDFRNNLNLLSQLINPSDTELNIGNDDINASSKILLSATGVDENNGNRTSTTMIITKSILSLAPLNSPIVDQYDHSDPNEKRATPSGECRKSIDKIYTLMKKLGKPQDPETKSTKTVDNNTEKVELHGPEIVCCQGSDSGTSLKQHSTSSEPSSFSFEKHITAALKPGNSKPCPTSVVPKVIISTRSSQIHKVDSEKNKKKRSIVTPNLKIPDNPLKAISHLLHEFENVQKTRHKPVIEHKPPKKVDILSPDGKSGSRQISNKRRLDQHNEGQTERNVRIVIPKEKKSRQYTVMDVPKIPYQQSPVEEKQIEKTSKKKITDILDEAKEARGEAVRGPSKLNSRLNSLAQPKRTYVQAHSEEYQTKYGKTLMADRLQRLAAAPPPSLPERNIGSASSRNKMRRGGNEPGSVKRLISPVPPLERTIRRYTSRSSPEQKERLDQGVGLSYKQITVPETPQMLNKTMVAVESYVKNHYGHVTSTTVLNELQSAHKSRVPLVPTDMDLASSSSSPSGEGSTELGSKLHNIINSILKTTSQGLEVLTECQETNSKVTTNASDDYSADENLSGSEHASSESIYQTDDNNVMTSVKNIDKASEKQQEQIKIAVTDATQYDLQPFKSSTELEKLENGLCSHISVGAFPKRLRINNFTLTPKPTRQQMYVLQSGDAGSLFVQAPMSQNTKETKADTFSDINVLPVLSKSHLDWSFLQFPIIGYAFPEYPSGQHTNSLVKLSDKKNTEEDKPLVKTSIHCDKDNQCCKCRPPHLALEQAAQAGVPTPKLVTIGISSTYLVEPDKNKQINHPEAVNLEPKHAFIDYSKNQTHNKEDVGNMDRTPTKVLAKKENSSSTVKQPEDMEHSTSLDILVGLLNEIQKITTCQSLITNVDKSQTDQQKKELETILLKAATLESSMKSSLYDVVSFTSLDRLRQLESNQSIYSFYLSDNEGFDIDGSKIEFPAGIIPLSPAQLSTVPLNKNVLCSKPVCVDKEVGVDFMDRECVPKCTEIPTQVVPVSINHSTNMTNSLIDVLSEPSTQSMFSFSEYHSIYSNSSSLDHQKTNEIPQIIITRESNQSLAYYEVTNQVVENSSGNKIQLCKKETGTFRKEGIRKIAMVTNGKYHMKSGFDPIMKMKRDVLVTVYSILVFTVFAALSFPEILYRF